MGRSLQLADRADATLAAMAQRKKKKAPAGALAALEAKEIGSGKVPAEVADLAATVEEDGGSALATYRDPYGGHWLILAPDREVALRILALNTEKAHNLKDKSLEVVRMAVALAEAADSKSLPEAT